jgi:microcystin-dependent protein
MGVVNTTYTFTSTDTITSAKMNNIIDDTTFTSDAIQGTTLQVVSPGKLAVSAGGITSNELAAGSVTTNALADGAVTQAKASNMLLPAGAIMAFAMNGAPSGWLAANGSAVSRTTYANLFAAIGTAYGSGDGSTTFNLPNLQGIFVRGSGSQTLGGVSYSRSFATTQNDALQNISGTVGQFDAAFGTTVATGAFTTTQTTKTTGGGGTGKYLTADFNASRVARTDVETRPVNIAMLYCIKI